MPYADDDLVADYTQLQEGTHTFAFNKVVGFGILINATVDYEDPSVWAAHGVADPATIQDEVKIIPQVIGTYDGGSPTEDKGYGDKLTQITANTHTIDLRCEYNAVNKAFMNKLMNSNNYGVVFFSGNFDEMEVVTGVNASFTAKPAITDEQEKPREWTIQVKWSKIALPVTVAHDASVVALFK